MTSRKDGLLNRSLAEYIYILTVQPVKYTRLSSLFASFCPQKSLEEACKDLGYYSFNDYLRQNHSFFNPFLTMFVCKNPGAQNTENPFDLYYYNVRAKSNPKCDFTLVEQEYVDPLRVGILFEESIFFEVHNSLDIIDKRKEFVKLVQHCLNNGLTTAKGMVPLNKMCQAFRKLYDNEEFSNTIKTWFPNRGGIENIMQKVLFEDVIFTLSDQIKRKECEFGLKEGCNDLKFDQLKSCLQKIKVKIELGLFLKTNEEITAEKALHSLNPPPASVTSESSDETYGDSSSDEKDVKYVKRPVIWRTFTVKCSPKKPEVVDRNGETEKSCSIPLASPKSRKVGYSVFGDSDDSESLTQEKLVKFAKRYDSESTSAASFEDSDDDDATAKETVQKVSSALMNLHFYYPSSVDLKNCCEKLELGFHQKAYAFWGSIEIDKFSLTSVPDKLHSNSNNGFASISRFLTGSEDYALVIKEVLNKCFFDNMKTLGNESGYDISSWDHSKVSATLFTNAMVDIHFVALVHLIHCRIGIFDGEKWTRYGIWNEGDSNVVTFLLAFINDMYCPILSLKD
uniref:Uncharacterized protein n=1 Tax=Panagrolaimus sp. ES5 TaxID=591445 RepID=A0AC34GTQ3_9BILA